MRPEVTFFDVTYIRRGNSVCFSDFPAGHASVGEKVLYFNNVLSGELGAWVGGSVLVAQFVDFILHIIGMSSCNNMLWVYTSSVVASVAEHLSCCRYSMRKFVGSLVGECLPAAVFKFTISIRPDSTSPCNTFGSWVGGALASKTTLLRTVSFPAAGSLGERCTTVGTSAGNFIFHKYSPFLTIVHRVPKFFNNISKLQINF